MKAELDNITYRFGVYSASRGYCDDCGQKADTVLVRIFSPIKEELRICYSCLIGCVRKIKKERHRCDKKTGDEIRKTKLDNLAKARAKKKEKKNGILPKVLDDVKGGKPAIKKKNDGSRDKIGGLSNATPPDKPSSVYRPSQ